MANSDDKGSPRRAAVASVAIGFVVGGVVGALIATLVDADNARPRAASTQQTAATTTIPATTSPTTVASAPCRGASTVAAAVQTSPAAGLSTTSSKYDVRNVRVAPSDPTWARFDDLPKAGVTDFQGGYGIVNCQASQWVVTDVGTSGVGCPGGTNPIPPPAVRADLGLNCP